MDARKILIGLTIAMVAIWSGTGVALADHKTKHDPAQSCTGDSAGPECSNEADSGSNQDPPDYPGKSRGVQHPDAGPDSEAGTEPGHGGPPPDCAHGQQNAEIGNSPNAEGKLNSCREGRAPAN